MHSVTRPRASSAFLHACAAGASRSSASTAGPLTPPLVYRSSMNGDSQPPSPRCAAEVAEKRLWRPESWRAVTKRRSVSRTLWAGRCGVTVLALTLLEGCCFRPVGLVDSGYPVDGNFHENSGDGGESAANTADSGLSAAIAFLHARDSLYCDSNVKCNGGVAAYLSASVSAACAAEDLPSWDEVIASEIDAGKLVFDSSAAELCLQALYDAGCSALGGNLPTACDQVWTGEVPPGGACRTDDCDSGYCGGPFGCGTCASFLADDAGPCGSQGECAPNLFCGSDARCHPGSESGGTCEQVGGIGDVCQEPLACDQAGVCVSLGLGSPCPSNGLCPTGLFCSYAATSRLGTCQPRRDGGPCGENTNQALNGGESECSYGLRCVGLSFAQSPDGGIATTGGQCLPLGDVDAGCIPLPAGRQGITGCAAGLACQDGFCIIPPASGPCASDPYAPCEELGHYCERDSGTCQPYVALGAPCGPEDYGQCGPLGDCVDGGCASSIPAPPVCN